VKQVKQLILYILFFSPSKIKALYYKKIKGYSIGKNVIFERKSWIYGENVIIQDNVKIGKHTIINSKYICIGKNTIIEDNAAIVAAKSIRIGNNCFIDKKVVFGGGQTRHSELKIGNRVKIFEQAFINTTRKVVLEDEVGIGGRTLIFTHGTWQNTYKGYPYKFGDVVIKKQAWLPWQVFVMPGVTIGKNATIGSASMVVNDIPDDCFAVGFPAKVIKQKDDYVKQGNEFKQKLLKEIFEETCLDYNYLHNKEYQFDENKLCISDGNNSLIMFVHNYDLNEDSPYTLYITDTKDELNTLSNYINLSNNEAVIKNKTHFIDFFIAVLSNYGIRIIEN